nr:hypothetical protein [uncultured Sphingomonas sp.]
MSQHLEVPRPLHRRAGLHRVIIGEEIFYLNLAKIQAVYEDEAGFATIVLDAGARIGLAATAHDILEGIADACAEAEVENAEEVKRAVRAMRERRHAGDRTRQHEVSDYREATGRKDVPV